jgi:hypothetical protein
MAISIKVPMFGYKSNTPAVILCVWKRIIRIQTMNFDMNIKLNFAMANNTYLRGLVVVAKAINPKVLHGVSNSAWSKMTMLQRYEFGSLESYSFQGLNIYTGATVRVDTATNSAEVEDFVSKFVVVAPDYSSMREMLDSDSIIFTLSTGLLVKKYELLPKDVSLHVMGSVSFKRGIYVGKDIEPTAKETLYFIMKNLSSLSFENEQRFISSFEKKCKEMDFGPSYFFKPVSGTTESSDPSASVCNLEDEPTVKETLCCVLKKNIESEQKFISSFEKSEHACNLENYERCREKHFKRATNMLSIRKECCVCAAITGQSIIHYMYMNGASMPVREREVEIDCFPAKRTLYESICRALGHKHFDSTNLNHDIKICVEGQMFSLGKMPGDFTKTCGKINMLSQKAENFLDYAETNIDRVNILSEKAEYTLDKASHFIETVEKHYEEVIEYIKTSLPKFLPQLANVLVNDAVMLFDFVVSVVTKNLFTFASVVTRLAARLGMSDSVVSSLTGKILSLKEYFTSPNQERMGDLEGQAGGNSILSVIVALVGTFVTYQKVDAKNVKQVVDILRTFNISVPAANNIISLVEKIGEWLPTFVYAWTAKLFPKYSYKIFLEHGFIEWIEAIEKFDTGENLNKVKYDKVTQAKADALMEEGKSFLRRMIAVRQVPIALAQQFRKYYDKIEKIMELRRFAQGLTNKRMEPFSICLTGAPGVGKSTIATTIAELLKPEGLPSNGLVYTRKASNDYWDGYFGQFAVFYDDWAADSESKDMQELIDVVSPAIMPLPMASLDNPIVGVKGTCFSSDLVIMTTNTPCPNSPTLRCHEAVFRRRDVIAEAVVRPEFTRNAKIDWQSIPKEVLENYSHLQWFLLNPKNGQREGGLIETAELFELIAIKWVAQRKHQRELFERQNSNDLVTNLRQKMALYLSESQSCRREMSTIEQERSQWQPSVPLVEGQMYRAMDSEYFVRNVEKMANPLGTTIKVSEEGITIGATVVESELEDYLRKHLPSQPVYHETSWLEECAASWKEFLQSKTPLAIVLKAGAIVSSCAVIFAIFKYGWNKAFAMKKPEYDPECQMAMYDHSTGRAAKKNVVTRRPRIQMQYQRGDVDVENTDEDVQAHDILMKKVVPYMATISCVELDGTPRKVCGYRIGGKNLLIPKHIFAYKNGWLPSGTIVDVAFEDGTSYEVSFHSSDVSEILGSRKRDVCVWNMGPRVPSAPDNGKLFVKESDARRLLGKSGSFISRDDTLSCQYFPTLKSYADRLSYSFGEDSEVYELIDSFAYNVKCSVGSCGSIIMIHDKTMNQKLCGIHVAGVVGRSIGFGEPVYFEDVEPFLGRVKNHYPEYVGLTGEEPRLDIKGNFSIHGQMVGKRQIHSPDKSVIIPSPAFECLGKHSTEPAVLSPFDKRNKAGVDPLIMSIEKYARMCSPFDRKMLKLAAAGAYNDFIGQFSEYSPHVLTEFEAINGTDEPYMDAMKMDTAPGYYYKLIGRKLKKDCFYKNENNEYSISCPLLRKRLDHREAMAKEGHRIESIWQTCLKDERRPIEKIVLGKTRTFSNGPLDFVILMRKYCLHFAAHFYSRFNESSSAVGMDCESHDWHRMVCRLRKVSTEGFGGDFGRFDGTLSAECMSLVCDMINQYYRENGESSPVNELVREVLFDELCHPVNIARDCLYAHHGGNPSGNPLTVVVNTIINGIYLRYVWFSLAPPQYASNSAFDKYVSAKIYGDDNILAVAPEVSHFYNMQTVSEAFAEMGLEYLAPWKDATDITVAPLEKWTFLKRGITRVEEISPVLWVAQMDQTVILEIIYWIRKCDDHHEALQQNVDAATRFAFFHGPSYYNSFVKGIAGFMKKWKKPALKFIPFEEYKQVFLFGRMEDHIIYSDLDGSDFEIEGQMDQRVSRGQDMTMPDQKTGTSAPVDQQIESAKGDTSSATEVGITTQDTQVPVIEQPSETGAPVSMNESNNLGDAPWDLCEMAARPALLETVQWTTSQTRFTSVAMYECPFQVIPSDTNNTPFERFTYWRGNMHFRFRVNGTPFHQGRILAMFVPMTKATLVSTWHNQNFAAATSVQGVWLNPASNDPVEMTIPFYNQNTMINISTDHLNPFTDFTGTLSLLVFNSLRAGTGASQAVSVSIQVSFPDSVFKVPRASFAFPPSNFLKKMKQIRALPVEQGQKEYKKFMRELNQRKNFVVEDQNFVVEGQMGSSSSKTENNNTTIVKGNNNDIGGSSNTGASKASSSIDGSLDASIPDFRVHFGQPRAAIKGSVGPLATTKGDEDNVHSMSFNPHSRIVQDVAFYGTTEDEMDLGELAKRMTFISATTADLSSQDVITWNGSDAPSTLLWTRPICPCAHFLSNNVFSDAGATDYGAAGITSFMSLFDYVVCKADFWSGSLRYMFMAVPSSVHSGRLAVTLTFGTNTAPINFEDADDQFIHFFDMTGENTSFVVEVPYISNKPKLFIPQLMQDYALRHNVFQQYATGFIQLWVVNQLVYPAAVSQEVEINVFKGAGDDFIADTVTANNANLLPVEGQMNRTGGSGTYPVGRKVYFREPDSNFKRVQLNAQEISDCYTGKGEAIYHLSELLSRYTFFANNYGMGAKVTDWPNPNSTSDYDLTNAVHCAGGHTVAQLIEAGLFAWYGPMYATWRGGVKVKLLANGNQRNGDSIYYRYSMAYVVGQQVTRANFNWSNGLTFLGDIFYPQVVRYGDPFANSINNTLIQAGVNDGWRQALSSKGWPAAEIAGLGQLDWHPLPSGISPPIDFNDVYAPVQSIRVPYTSVYRTMRVRRNDDPEMPYDPSNVSRYEQFYPAQYNNTGTIYIFAHHDNAAVNASAVKNRYNYTILVAADKDFRYGVFLGPHKVVVKQGKGPGSASGITVSLAATSKHVDPEYNVN